MLERAKTNYQDDKVSFINQHLRPVLWTTGRYVKELNTLLEADSPWDVWFQILSDLNEIRLQVATLSQALKYQFCSQL